MTRKEMLSAKPIGFMGVWPYNMYVVGVQTDCDMHDYMLCVEVAPDGTKKPHRYKVRYTNGCGIAYIVHNGRRLHLDDILSLPIRL